MPGVLEERNRYTLYLVAAIAVVAIIIFWQLMVALIFAGSIAVIALPLHKRFTGKIGAEASAALVTIIMFLIFVAVIAFAVGLLLQNQEFLNSLVSTIIELGRTRAEQSHHNDAPYQPDCAGRTNWQQQPDD